MGNTLLNFQRETKRIQEMYMSSVRSNAFRGIVFSKIKIGKTHLLGTCRKPVLVYSFDPDGVNSLKEFRDPMTGKTSNLIETGEVIVMNEYEKEDPLNPSAFRSWMADVELWEKNGWFDYIGTIAIDTCTTWSDVIMNQVIYDNTKREALNKKKGPAGKKTYRYPGAPPHQQDWGPQMSYIKIWLRKLLATPCDVILLGHEDTPKDINGNRTGDTGLMITGKLRKLIPALFSEIYQLVMVDYETGERKLNIKPIPGIQIGTRFDSLDDTEEPSINHIKKKIGIYKPDLPVINFKEEGGGKKKKEE